MYHLCSMTKWAALPEAGGLYDQDPVLLDKFLVIHAEIGKAKEEEQKAHKAEMERKSRSKKR